MELYRNNPLFCTLVSAYSNKKRLVGRLTQLLMFPGLIMPQLSQHIGASVELPLRLRQPDFPISTESFQEHPRDSNGMIYLVGDQVHIGLHPHLVQPYLRECCNSISSFGAPSCMDTRPTETVIPVGDDGDEVSAMDEYSNLIDADQKQCRICLENEGEDLIAPCHCRGTQKYIHRSCLDKWRSITEAVAFANCTVCGAAFHLRTNIPLRRWLKLKFQFLVARDHALIFIFVQLVVTFFCMLAYKFYGEELQDMFGYKENRLAFYILAVMSIIMMGLISGLFIAMICGHKITERHYHVLAKQELAKVYVVEHWEDNKDPPALDSELVTELRMLGLY